MSVTFQPIAYNKLNSKQKESFNFQKVSAVLADFGFITIRMTSDWGGADFIAQHKDGVFLKVQLKSRLSFYEKYRGKKLFICFGEKNPDCWYLYPHDEMLEMNLNSGCIGRDFWNAQGGYSKPKLSKKQRELLKPYKMNSGQALSL